MNNEVYFFIEHKTREYESMKKISQILASKYSISSKILSIPFHSHHLVFLKSPALFLLPYCISMHDWPFKAIYQHFSSNVAIMNMCWEQLLTKSNKDYKKPRGQYLLNKIYYIAWNTEFKRYLTDVGVKKDNIEICGNPNLSLLESLKQSTMNISKTIRNRYSICENYKICFLPMNYAWAFLSQREIKHRITRGYDREKAEKYHEISKKSLNMFIDFVSNLAEKHSHLIFVVRPHPGVITTQYKSMFGTRMSKNIIISSEYSVNEWILASDIVGSSWSTVVHDANLYGKQTFLFQPIPLPDWLYVDWMDKVPKLKNINEFDELVYNEKQDRVEKKGFEDDYFENVACFIAKLTEKQLMNKVSKKSLTLELLLLYLRFFIRSLLSRVHLQNKHLMADYFKVENV